jgi:hypothetical protein
MILSLPIRCDSSVSETRRNGWSRTLRMKSRSVNKMLVPDMPTSASGLASTSVLGHESVTRCWVIDEFRPNDGNRSLFDLCVGDHGFVLSRAWKGNVK